jgi:hypothetical protein
MEKMAAERGENLAELGLERLDAYWDAVKARGDS